MNEMERYGALLKQRREDQGKTIEDVASAIGRPTSFVWRWENAKNANPPDVETMRRFWRTLQVPMRSQLVSLGFLDPEEQEPGVAYTIREGDPRVALLDAVEGLGDADVAAVAGAVGMFADAFRRKMNLPTRTDLAG